MKPFCNAHKESVTHAAFGKGLVPRRVPTETRQQVRFDKRFLGLGIFLLVRLIFIITAKALAIIRVIIIVVILVLDSLVNFAKRCLAHMSR